jgi:hypothetical protein
MKSRHTQNFPVLQAISQTGCLHAEAKHCCYAQRCNRAGTHAVQSGHSLNSEAGRHCCLADDQQEDPCAAPRSPCPGLTAGRHWQHGALARHVQQKQCYIEARTLSVIQANHDAEINASVRPPENHAVMTLKPFQFCKLSHRLGACA